MGMGEVEVGGLCGNAKLVCLMVPCNGGGKKTNVSARLSQGNHDYLGLAFYQNISVSLRSRQV